jgi:hypothetical protein
VKSLPNEHALLGRARQALCFTYEIVVKGQRRSHDIPGTYSAII